MPAREGAPVIVVMGVSGSGKSTLGTRLADVLGVEYAEGDDFHPAANVAKMAAGTPLDDADRAPWLDAVAAWMAEHTEQGAWSAARRSSAATETGCGRGFPRRSSCIWPRRELNSRAA